MSVISVMRWIADTSEKTSDEGSGSNEIVLNMSDGAKRTAYMPASNKEQ